MVSSSSFSRESPFLQFSSPTSSPILTQTSHTTPLSTPLPHTPFPIFTQATRLTTQQPPFSRTTNLNQQLHPSYYSPCNQNFTLPPFPQQFSPLMNHTTNPPPYRNPKLELSPFDGLEPLEWLFQVEQFFTFYHIPIESRLSMSSFYMKGDALNWFKWMYQNHQLFDWNSFTKAIELRFRPSTYANHQAELFKLRQTGSVSDYQAQFEKLCNRVIGLPAEALLNCFISGLNTEILNEMAIKRPTIIT